MPIHDWTRVSAGTFHDFHTSWIVEIKRALNNGILPRDYYALAEQIAGEFGPDVITLQNSAPGEDFSSDSGGGTAVALSWPQTSFSTTFEVDQYAAQQRRLVVRHSSGDRVIALIEIVSPGNKASQHAIRSFVEKATAALTHGYHFLLIDLMPPGPRDPQGMHGAICEEMGKEPYGPPPGKRLTLASYSAGEVVRAFGEPVTVGDALPDMPLFLKAEAHVLVPLETTYRAAWEGVPRRWRTVLESPPA